MLLEGHIGHNVLPPHSFHHFIVYLHSRSTSSKVISRLRPRSQRGKTSGIFEIVVCISVRIFTRNDNGHHLDWICMDISGSVHMKRVENNVVIVPCERGLNCKNRFRPKGPFTLSFRVNAVTTLCWR